MTLKLSANFLGENGFEPQRAYCGFIYVPKPPFYGKDADELPASDPLSTKILALAVDNYTLPSYGIEILNLGWMNEEIKFPGKATVDELTWVLRDFVDVEVANILDAWYALTFDPTDGIAGRMSVYKRNAYAVLLGNIGKSSADKNRWYRLEGAYPSRIERGDIDHTGSDYVKITVTLSIDRVVPLFLDDYSDDNKAKFFAGSENSFKLPVPKT